MRFFQIAVHHPIPDLSNQIQDLAHKRMRLFIPDQRFTVVDGPFRCFAVEGNLPDNLVPQILRHPLLCLLE